MRPLVAIVALLLTLIAGCDRCGCDADAPVAPPQAPKPAPETAPTGPEVTARPAPGLPPVPEGALTPEELASCDDAGDLLARTACLAALAQRQRDPRYCTVVAELSAKATEEDPAILRSGTAADACRRTIAYMRDEPKLCAEIVQSAMAGSCLSWFAKKQKNTAVCDLGNGEEASQFCYQNEAARNRDPSLCAKTGPFREDCERRLGPIGSGAPPEATQPLPGKE